MVKLDVRVAEEFVPLSELSWARRTLWRDGSNLVACGAAFEEFGARLTRIGLRSTKIGPRSASHRPRSATFRPPSTTFGLDLTSLWLESPNFGPGWSECG